MPASLTILSHALAALLFGALALGQLRHRHGGLPHATLVTALGATALWALAVAGIGSGDVATRLTEGARTLAWLAFMFALMRQESQEASRRGLAAVYAVCALIGTAAIVLAVAEAAVGQADAATVIAPARLALRMLGTITALLLLYRIHATSPRGEVRAVALALAVIFVLDLLLLANNWTNRRWAGDLGAVRGLGMVAVAPLFGLALQRDGEWSLQVSRRLTFGLLSALLIGAYFAITGLAASLLAEVGGDRARMVQTVFVFGTAAALLTIVSTPWLRATAKVLVAKHLFRHRYDYRAEWLRFNETLGSPGESAAPLSVRVVKAVADVTDSPAGLLLAARDGTLERGAGWNWAGEEAEPVDTNAALHVHLAATHRIIELDAVRAGSASPADAGATPAWLLECADAWAIVPLVHFDRLTGALVLARPPLDRALDWEDFDLLGVAGRQVASYLAEDRAHDALADGRRFDEFNRRFAFIMHDLKNLVSQLTLLARNAERHADNPAFRADMVETLRDSSQRMNKLLARLSQHHGGRGEVLRAVPLHPLAERIAAARRAQHPVAVSGTANAVAVADAAGLETLLGHLVQNAIEASAVNVPVTLNIVALPESRQVAVEVIDAGCGMAPAFMRDQLFKPFVSSKEGGFGLGAFEARQLAEAMGGAVSVDSRLGEGTRFRVTLRAADELEQAA
ncbi:XrtA/PEP-CTERM system histidine kinase PrsK [uncultured Sphingomonas sp.]|uniref:XrtA/PEP-CTERM system histidine kinase PrsK n=1 Tax=uncultured Sphingomonas sp. TaxID=158754 RepID=UPI002616F7CD|nr:XrtA/PEP-CTERM system histidine kinase PrsK [uncultured Sphingomonas sp.]